MYKSIPARSKIAVLLALASTGAAAPAVGADADASIRTAVARFAPGLPIASIRATPLDGIHEVQVGTRVLYVSSDGAHVLEGTLTDVANGRDLTEASRGERRRQVLAELPESAKIGFAPDAPRHRVTVFTAIDCGFCRKFHDDIDGYLAEGIAVDYVMIPLAGPGSPADTASRSVYCADDRQAAFTAATAGRPMEAPSCASSYPLAVTTAAMLGISRTPTIVSSSGEIVGGFLTPVQLRERLSR